MSMCSSLPLPSRHRTSGWNILPDSVELRRRLSSKSTSTILWRWSSSAEVSFQRHPEAARATNTQQTWRQEFLGSRSSTVERSSTRTTAAGTFLRFLQTIFENTSLWQLKRLVSLSTYRRYINKCIYLSIYLLLVPTTCRTTLNDRTFPVTAARLEFSAGVCQNFWIVHHVQTTDKNSTVQDERTLLL